MAGSGVELEKEENMWVTRLGIAAMWDDKWGNYNSWVVEFSFTKIFFRKRK